MTKMTELRRIILERDGLSNEAFDEILYDILGAEGDDEGPCGLARELDEILLDYFGLEPDYIFDLVEEFDNLDSGGPRYA